MSDVHCTGLSLSKETELLCQRLFSITYSRMRGITMGGEISIGGNQPLSLMIYADNNESCSIESDCQRKDVFCCHEHRRHIGHWLKECWGLHHSRNGKTLKEWKTLEAWQKTVIKNMWLSCVTVAYCNPRFEIKNCINNWIISILVWIYIHNCIRLLS